MGLLKWRKARRPKCFGMSFVGCRFYDMYAYPCKHSEECLPKRVECIKTVGKNLAHYESRGEL